jgi:hypothetical protein
MKRPILVSLLAFNVATPDKDVVNRARIQNFYNIKLMELKLRV